MGTAGLRKRTSCIALDRILHNAQYAESAGGQERDTLGPSPASSGVRPCLGLDGQPCPTRSLTDSTRCPDCTRTKDRSRQATRPGYPRQYRAARAIVLAGATRCYVPGCPEPPTTADHIRPLKDGGSHEVGNLRPSCVKHNSGRRDTPGGYAKS